MSVFNKFPRQRICRRSVGQWVVLVCVLVTVALYGVTSSVVALFGSYHTHTVADAGEAPVIALEDFRRVDHEYDALGVTRPHAHSHLSLQRHHHDPNDASVQSVDAGAQGPLGDGAATSATGAFAVTTCALCLLIVAAPPARRVRWTVAGCPAIPVGHAHRVERPPRA